MCEQILVTRDAVLIQPSGDPVSSGLPLRWLHHSYLSVIFLCDLRQPRRASKLSTAPSRPVEMHIVRTHVFVHTCGSFSAGSATEGQLAAAWEECADMHMHTYLTDKCVYIFTRTLQSILSTARAVFDMRLENVFKAYWLE